MLVATDYAQFKAIGDVAADMFAKAASELSGAWASVHWPIAILGFGRGKTHVPMRHTSSGWARPPFGCSKGIIRWYSLPARAPMSA